MNKSDYTFIRKPLIERLVLFVMSYVFWVMLIWPVTTSDGRLLVGDLVFGVVVALFVALVMHQIIRVKFIRLVNPRSWFWGIVYIFVLGYYVIKHTDGNIMPILDMIVETGADALNPLEPQAGMDIGRIKQAYGDRIALVGNIDCGYLLSEAPADEVREHYARALELDPESPEALDTAGFTGALLPPLGEDEGVPALIADTLRTAAQ